MKIDVRVHIGEAAHTGHEQFTGKEFGHLNEKWVALILFPDLIGGFVDRSQAGIDLRIEMSSILR